MTYFKLKKYIRIIHADKGNFSMVLDDSKYKDKLNMWLEFRVL
jgi:hypothetical protein